MAIGIEKWNENPAANNFDPPDGAPENQSRRNVNNIVREGMARTADLYQGGLEWLDLLRNPLDRTVAFTVARASATTFTVTSGTTDLSFMFNTGRRVKLTTAGADTDFVDVASVSYANPLTTVTINPLQVVTVGIDGCLLISITSLGSNAFTSERAGGNYLQPLDYSDAAFQVALDEATALGGATILLTSGTYNLTSTKTITDKVRIIGNGMGSTIVDFTGTGGTSLFSCSGVNNGFESLTITDSGGVGGGGDRHGIYTAGSCTDMIIHDVEIVTSTGNAIHLTEGGFRGIFTGIKITSPGWSGIYCPDPDSDTNPDYKVNRFTDIVVRSPGFGGATTRYGLDLAGIVHCTNITVEDLDLGSPTEPTGIRLNERLAASPDEDDAKRSTIKGVNINGSGLKAVGVRLNGRYCTLLGGDIQLTGTGSVGVLVKGTLGQQLAQFNLASGLSITAGTGYDETGTNATRNMVSECRFYSCGIDVQLGTAQSVVQNCQMYASTSGSIRLITGAVDCVVKGNVIHSTSGEGVRTYTGATDNLITGNNVISASGTFGDYIDSVALNHFISNYPLAMDDYFRKTANSTLTTTTTTAAITQWTAVDFPLGDGKADGRKTFKINVSAWVNLSNSAEVEISIHVGQNGTVADAVVWRSNFFVSGGTFSEIPVVLDCEVVPTFDDVVTISWRRTSGASTVTMYGGTGTSRTSAMSITRKLAYV